MVDQTSIAAISGVILSVLADWIPGFSPWYASQGYQKKRLVMAGLVLLTAVAIFLLACYSPLVYAECSERGAWELVELVTAVLIGNQSAHMLFKRDGDPDA